MAAWLVALTPGCAQNAAPSEDRAPDVAHDFEPITVSPGEETAALCQQWTPGHAEALSVNALRMVSSGGYHHMNFFYVPEDHMPGPDGTFPCADRGYDMRVAALLGGVLFAQSTQATSEVQQFGPGAVVQIPPGFKVVGNLHLLNTTPDPLEAHLRFELFTLPDDRISSRLTGFMLQYGALDIAGTARSQFSTTCSFDASHQALFGRPADFGIRWLLPHYHALGELLRVELLREGGSEVLVETTKPIGEPVGKAFDPPATLVAGDQIHLTCGFDNPGTSSVGWGLGEAEMCIVFGFSDSRGMFLGDGNVGATQTGVRADGVIEHEALCDVIGAVPAVNN